MALANGFFLLAITALLATPAAATTTREAIRLCEKNKNCDFKTGDIWTDIKVGDNIIQCPTVGNDPCICVACAPPKRVGQKPGMAGGKPAVLAVLNSP